MTEYERGFIDGVKSKVTAELTPTLINVSKTMLEMLKPVLSTALENDLNDNNTITDTDAELVKCGQWENEHYDELLECYEAICSECGYESTDKYHIADSHRLCENCGARMIKDGDING